MLTPRSGPPSIGRLPIHVVRMRFRSPLRCVLALLCLLTAVFVAWQMWLRPVGDRTGSVPQALPDGWRRSTPRAEGFDEAALASSLRRLTDGPYNVHSVLVERNGRLVAEIYQGGSDRSVYSLLSVRRRIGPNDLHDVRSVGKSVTGLLYGIALAEGKVPAPARRLSTVFPQLDAGAASNARQTTVRDLLDMTSGLVWREGAPGSNDELRLFWKRDLPGYVLGHSRAAPAGSTFNYNGGGTALLAQLITAGTGLPLDRYVQQRLFGPLGITEWEWVEDLHGRPMAFNGLRVTPRGLLKLGRLVQDDGRWNGRQIVPRAWIRDSWAPGHPTEVADFRYRGQWWAGTVTWKGRELPWHAAFGNGGQRLFIIPELDVVLVTTAGAYDHVPTAIAVNRLVQDVASSVRE